MMYYVRIWVICFTATAPADDATIGKALLHKEFLWHAQPLKAQS
jgi:hypothetical protein